MRDGFITRQIRSTLQVADKPVTIKFMRESNPELEEYRSLSACLTEMMKYGKPLLGRRKNKAGCWEYFIRK